jgi:hypothetical protein
MDDAEATAEGGNGDEDRDDTDDSAGGLPTWTELFVRAEPYGTDETAVGEALARRRGRTDD